MQAENAWGKQQGETNRLDKNENDNHVLGISTNLRLDEKEANVTPKPPRRR